MVRDSAQVAANNAIRDLNLIKSKLGLSKVELAKVSKIPRTELYKVLTSELVVEEHHQRIRYLADIIKSTFESGIPNRAALKNFYVEGKNLIQLLSEESFNRELIESLASQITSKINKRTKSINRKLCMIKPNNSLDPEFDSTWSSSGS